MKFLFFMVATVMLLGAAAPKIQCFNSLVPGWTTLCAEKIGGVKTIVTPTPSPAPSISPTPQPTPTPVPTASPTVAPTATPQPSPTPSATPNPYGSVVWEAGDPV